jgi:pimeloyl-ACP methyl ester carboxylesterase
VRTRVLLLHGALGDSRQLGPLAAALQDSFDVQALDFEGHGRAAPRGRPFRVEHFAENVLEFLGRASPGPAHYFGYSMGGYVALYLATIRPELVLSVATLGTKFRWNAEEAERQAAALDPVRIRAKVPRFAAALAERHVAAGWETVLVETAGMMRALGERPLLDPAALATIKARVRICVGDRDATVDVDESAEAYRALPAGELEVLPGTPHPFEKAPLARLAQTFAEFYARPPADQRGAADAGGRQRG